MSQKPCKENHAFQGWPVLLQCMQWERPPLSILLSDKTRNIHIRLDHFVVTRKKWDPKKERGVEQCLQYEGKWSETWNRASRLQHKGIAKPNKVDALK